MSLAERLIEQGKKEGLEKGLEKGLQKGREEGLNRGELIGEIRLAQKLLGLPQASKEELFALSEAALQNKWSELERQLS